MAAAGPQRELGCGWSGEENGSGGVLAAAAALASEALSGICWEDLAGGGPGLSSGGGGSGRRWGARGQPPRPGWKPLNARAGRRQRGPPSGSEPGSRHLPVVGPAHRPARNTLSPRAAGVGLSLSSSVELRGAKAVRGHAAQTPSRPCGFTRQAPSRDGANCGLQVQPCLPGPASVARVSLRLGLSP